MVRLMSSACLSVVRIHVIRKPLTRARLKKFFKGSRFERQIARFNLARFKTKAMDAASAIVDRQFRISGRGPGAGIGGSDCWLEHTSIELCANAQGVLVECRCEHWECNDGTTFKICYPI